ncbi:YHYH domain-containing protein [Lachnospiraceae bacterium 62-35]
MKRKKQAASLFMGLVLSMTAAASGFSPVITAEAHSGRTDSQGGHKDNKNKSGLGSYHYHCGGYPAHLHTNGVCPYAGGYGNSDTAGNNSSFGNTDKSSSTDTFGDTGVSGNTSSSDSQASSLGWQSDSQGWWYQDSETTYKSNGFFYIDGYEYYFNADGYMLVGWQMIEGFWYYFGKDGHMVTGEQHIDGKLYYFDENGQLDEDYFDLDEEIGEDYSSYDEDVDG